ncbi:hypothetical protein F5883DRAFT_649953 [Diaporthe sp. PMI_573]|nr:hypothetical protein F5883DRAFT_649953 [Diaporthaceae sp. PMI_573]
MGRASCVKGPVLELLGKDAWQSVELTAKEYHGLVYDAAKSWWLQFSLTWLRFDWMSSPDGGGGGVLTVRNPGSFEARLEQAVSAILTDRLNANELFRALGAYCEPLEPYLRARAAATGRGAGLRSASRTYHHDKKGDKKGDAEDDIWVAHFVLELVSRWHATTLAAFPTRTSRVKIYSTATTREMKRRKQHGPATLRNLTTKTKAL